MIIKTRYGDWEIDEEKIIFMEAPILGFERIREYALLPGGEGLPVFRLQAVEEPGVTFFVVEPTVFCPDYNPDLSKVYREMDSKDSEEMIILSIMTIREDPFCVSLNLRAPVVINARTKKGRQVVLEDDSFPVRYPIERSEGKRLDHDSPNWKGIERLVTEGVKHYG